VGVSQRTIVTHRFRDTFDFAKDQWLQDGKGLGRMVRKHGLRAVWLLALPVLAAARGITLSLTRWRSPRWVPYFVLYCLYNYVGMAGVMHRRLKRRGRLTVGAAHAATASPTLAAAGAGRN
jgi:hypothetical protein